MRPTGTAPEQPGSLLDCFAYLSKHLEYSKVYLTCYETESHPLP